MLLSDSLTTKGNLETGQQIPVLEDLVFPPQGQVARVYAVLPDIFRILNASTVQIHCHAHSLQALGVFVANFERVKALGNASGRDTADSNHVTMAISSNEVSAQSNPLSLNDAFLVCATNIIPGFHGFPCTIHKHTRYDTYGDKTDTDNLKRTL